MEQERSVKDAIQTVGTPGNPGCYSGYGNYRSLRAQQQPTELAEVIRAVEFTDPKVVVEIGTARGGTLYSWMRCLNPTMVISIDNNFETSPRFFSYLSSALGVDCACLRMDSHSSEAKEAVKSLSPNGIDFLYIDGDHSYNGVKSDHKMYGPLVNSGGVIGFHDASIRGEPIRDYWLDATADLSCDKYTEVGGPEAKTGLIFKDV